MRDKFRYSRAINLDDINLIDFNIVLKTGTAAEVAERIMDKVFVEEDLDKRSILDRMLDYVYQKTINGYMDIPNLAYPTRRMMDRELEERVIELINLHFYPEILISLLKFFARNIHESDTNLYMANLISSEAIIRSIYETFKLFRKDVFVTDRSRRTLNVKRIQQYTKWSDDQFSSPLDAAARFKYILEFLLVAGRAGNIYKKEDLILSP